MVGRGRRSPPPVVVNSEGRKEGSHGQGKVEVDSGWKRGGRLRSSMHGNIDSMESEDGSDGSFNHGDGRSQSPPLQCTPCLPRSGLLVRDEAMEEVNPRPSLNIDEEVLPKMAPLHAPFMENGSNLANFGMNDVGMDGGDKEMQGRLQSHGLRSSTLLSKKDSMACEVGSVDSLNREDESFQSPLLQRPSCSPSREPLERDDAMEEVVPIQEPKIDERVLPKMAPLHASMLEIGSNRPNLHMEDVVMKGNDKEMHGNMQSHGINAFPRVGNFPRLPTRDVNKVGMNLNSPSSSSTPSLLNGQHGVHSILGPSPFIGGGKSPPPRPPINGAPQSRTGQQPTNMVPQLQGANPSRSTPPNAWRSRKGFKFSETEPLCDILGDDGISIMMDGNESGMCRSRLEGALVAKIIGKPLPFPFLIRELKKRWLQFGHFQISPTGKDSFICIFSGIEARDAVLAGGPWFVGGQIIGMDSWSPKFNPASFKGITSPIWVRLPELPLQYWSPKNLGRIATKVGLPLWIDDYTLNWERLEYARVCVKVDFSQRLPNGVWLQGYQEKFFQPFVYEGISQLCFRCGLVGHNVTVCPLDAPKKVDSIPTATTEVREPPMTKEPTSLNKSARWADVMDSQTMPEPTPPDLEEHVLTSQSRRLIPQRSDDPTLVDGSALRKDSTEGKRPPTPHSSSHDDMGYGPWTLVTYKKKKSGPNRKNLPAQRNTVSDSQELPSSKVSNVDAPSQLIFSAVPTVGDGGSSQRRKSKAWRPKASTSKASVSSPMVSSVEGEPDLDGSRKRKKRNIRIEIGGGDASSLVEK